VVDRAFARRFWGEAGGPEAALGKRLRRGPTDDWATIVGVVGSVRGRTLDREPEPAVYWPAVAERREGALETARSVAYVVRAGAAATPGGLLPEVRRRIWSVDPDLALAEMGTLASLVDRAMARTSFTMAVLAIAAAVALFLGAVGVYGVISYMVSRRTREIGVRMALGAERRDVGRMVLRQGMTLAILGAAVGLAGAFGLTRLMASLLYGVAPQDPATYVAVTVLLALVAAGATWLPARRAAGLDPLEALRYE
jgi:predicted lysophospholipase L1 biosynthesis ABC-type transport system permease subunit